MWRAFDETGRLLMPDFVETTVKLLPMYLLRALGGALYITGMVLFGYNLLKTWLARPARYAEPVVQAAPLEGKLPEPVPAVAPSGILTRFRRGAWHRRWEGLPVTFTVWVVIAVIVASLFEIIPTFLIRSNVPTIASVKPYTPLELAGRDLYIREGCFNCHSQMIRPYRHETERYGEYSKPGEFVYDHPFLWGSRRIGPDLARQGGKYPDLWHVRHLEDPQSITPKSIMPAYPWLLENELDFAGIQRRVDAMAMLGVPYGEAITRAPELARAQARDLAAAIVAQGGPPGLDRKEIVALVAYLQRLGRDIKLAQRPARCPSGRRRRSARREATEMRLSDVIGGAGLAGYAEVALLLFLAAFLAIVLWLFWPGGRPPMSERPEADRLLDHQYDDIREYDNPLPRWWLATFYVTIAYSALYLLNVPGIGIGKGRIAAYEESVARASALAQAQDPLRDVTAERILAARHDSATLALGKATFATTCASCHGPDGGGIIGPNLTDEFYLHGGQPLELLRTVSEGVLAKGMPPWGKTLKPTQLLAVVAYVTTLRGTTPARPKAAEGTRVPAPGGGL
jgi:cbb3-type cytochrome c oxidase subunit II